MKKIFISTLAIIFSINISSYAKNDKVSNKKHSKGLVFDNKAYNRSLKKATLTRGMYVMPESYSLKEYAPKPANQGTLSTCTAWSTAYAARGIIENYQNKTSISKSFSPGFIYRSIQTDPTCNMGSNLEMALNVMTEKGVPPLDKLNSPCPDTIPSNIYNVSSNYKIKGYNRLFDIKESDEIKIRNTRKSISENKPVVIGMLCCTESFENAKDVWNPSDNYTSETLGGHAMTVIGYDDKKSGGAFEIQNSWGTEWGNGGYIWIPYNVFAKTVKYGYELLEKPVEKPVNIVNDEKVYDMEGKITLKLKVNSEMSAVFEKDHYKVGKSYPSGTQFRIYVNNTKPAYVYVIGSDLTNQVYKLFPHKDEISPYLNYKENEIALPDENHYIETDNNIGKDYLAIIYSKNALDIKKIMSEVKASSGDFYSKVKKVLGDKMVKNDNIDFKNESISFQANSENKSLVAIMIETKHGE